MNQFENNCPSCGVKRTYSTKQACRRAEKSGAKCGRCASIASGFIDRYATKGKSMGADNPFYGRTHSDATRKKIAERDMSCYKTDEFRKKMSTVTKGEKNPMHGRRVFDVWVEKYGLEHAQKLDQEWRAKESIASSGKNNPMYGKPSPGGSGNGWSGWYGEWYFRSLRELSYVILILEEQQLSWESAEKIRIPYVSPLGTSKTYSPDFLIDGRILVELKPVRLHRTPTVTAKAEAATKFCEDNGWEYQLIDGPMLSTEQIRNLHDSGAIRFLPRYEEKYVKRYY